MSNIVERLRDGAEILLLERGGILEHTTLTEAADEIERLRAELERERMRLAACGVVALSDTPESAANARAMHDDYKSASCDDVARRVDECLRLRAENEELRAEKAKRADYWQNELDQIRKELTAAKSEIDMRRKSGSASDRLHNICQVLADEADGSAWSRDEWDRLDTENAHLRAALKITTDQAQYVDSLRSDRAHLMSELAAAKALLRESVREAFDDAYVLHPEGIDLLNRIRAVLGENQ